MKNKKKMTDKITLELTLDELKALDKNLIYDEETKSVFNKVKDAYPLLKMTLHLEGAYAIVSYNETTYFRLMGEDSTCFSWYKRVVVIPSFPTPSLVMVDDPETERLLEDLYCNHIGAKKETAQQTEKWKEIQKKIDDGDFDDFIERTNLSDFLEDKLGYSTDSCYEIVNAISEWLPETQSADGSQNAYVESAVEGWNDCINAIRGKLQ